MDYFISYAYFSDRQHRFGNDSFTVKSGIINYDIIKEINKMLCEKIKDDYGDKCKVSIIYWKRFEE